MFKKFDANGDGKLTQDEVPADLWAKLQAGDANGDGAITADELPKPPADGDKPRGPEALFKKHDANGDGALTADEVPAELWEKLSRGDADGDGKITIEEMPKPPRDGEQPPKRASRATATRVLRSRLPCPPTPRTGRAGWSVGVVPFWGTGPGQQESAASSANTPCRSPACT